jgi:predicted DNA-binding protein (MmcQ/YjbR family)
MARAKWMPDEKVMAKVRKLVAGLPGAEEKSAWGHPVWRANGRHFAAYEPKQGQDFFFFVLEKEMVSALAKANPGYRDGGYSRGEIGWLGIPLDAKTDWGGEMKELLERSFTLATGMKPVRPRSRSKR